jgi:hypothetical protein
LELVVNSAVAQGPVALLDAVAPTPHSTSSSVAEAKKALGLHDAEELGSLRMPGPAAPEIAELEAVLEEEAETEPEKEAEADQKVNAWADSA